MMLFSLCDIPFWLLWLLPLLFALWSWWSGSNKNKKIVTDYEGRLGGLNSKISGLESNLSESVSKKNNLESDLALTKGRMREMEAASSKSSNSAKNTAKLTADYDTKISGLNSKIGDLEKQLANAKSNSSDASKLTADHASKVSGLNSKINDLEKQLSTCNSKCKELEGNVAKSKSNAAAIATTAESSESYIESSAPLPKVDTKYSGLKLDNLQLIEGIGPKMEEVLKENGISDLAILGSKSSADIQAILDKYGDKYKIMNPKTWPQQAKLGADGQWNELIVLQKKLDGGKDNAVGETDSKLENYLVKTGALKKWSQDDLTEIEGIGPATDKLLRENGINSWRDLANASVDNIKAILEKGGSRFSLGDPTTWPKQAELAADGEFDKLQEYQDFLDGGRG
ncbi:MAG: helix-hairpin-helix domain-containing protein [Saprospiraceae bacterium]